MNRTTHHRDRSARVRRDAEASAAHFPALMAEADRIAHTVASGLHGRRRAGPGETFWQHRTYAFGDPVSAIDWRQSARAADRLYVRQNEWEAATAIHIWRDNSRSLDYASTNRTPQKGLRADVIATALSILLSQAGERVGLLGAGTPLYHGRSAPTLILENLLARSPGADSAPPLAQLASGARVVLLSDFFSEPEAVAAAVSGYSAAGAKGALVQIIDPAEEDFPFGGRTEFQDVESPDRLTFGEAGALVEAYKARFASHRGAIEAAARRQGWTFLVHRTDRPAETALLALFTALGDFKLIA